MNKGNFGQIEDAYAQKACQLSQLIKKGYISNIYKFLIVNLKLLKKFNEKINKINQNKCLNPNIAYC